MIGHCKKAVAENCELWLISNRSSWHGGFTAAAVNGTNKVLVAINRKYEWSLAEERTQENKVVIDIRVLYLVSIVLASYKCGSMLEGICGGLLQWDGDCNAQATQQTKYHATGIDPPIYFLPLPWIPLASNHWFYSLFAIIYFLCRGIVVFQLHDPIYGTLLLLTLVGSFCQVTFSYCTHEFCIAIWIDCLKITSSCYIHDLWIIISIDSLPIPLSKSMFNCGFLYYDFRWLSVKRIW